MPGVPKLIIARPGYDVRTAIPRNLAFSSDYNLNKIARAIKSTSSGTVAHGLSYAPKVLTMEEKSGKFGWGRGMPTDNTNINVTVPSGSTIWSHILIDNLEDGSYKKDMTGKPIIKVGDNFNDSDHKQKIHSGYDTFKVAKTGTLTINASAYDPGAGGGTNTTTATFNHGLGYAPMFAPFVEYETELYFYYMANSAFNTSIANGGVWATSTEYKLAEDVMDSSYVNWYTCIKTHTSSAATEPGVGASWATYWKALENPDFTETYVNNLEDTKLNLWVFGDEEDHNYYYISLYSTSTQLVLEYKRVVSPSIPDFYEYQPEPASKVYVDYTIFYNPAGEEFSLL